MEHRMFISTILIKTTYSNTGQSRSKADFNTQNRKQIRISRHKKMTTLLLAMVLFICKMTGNIECQGDIEALNSKEKSERASKPCDILVRQDNIRNSRLKTTVQLPVQSSMKGKYTPWIAYRGCYQMSTLPTNQPTNDLVINNNTVGNCYRECKMKAMKNNSCGDNTDVLFGLQKSYCFCFCKAPVDISDLDQSDRCNITCSPSSFEDGECGGQGHFSAYVEFKPQGRPLAGLCLICSNNSSNIKIRGTDCDKIATGVCVSDDSLNSTVHFNGTMNSYWNNCKMKNRFITGNTDIVCQNTATWTGIRKYKIDADNQITTTSATVGSSYSPNNNDVVLIIGVSGTIIAVCVVVFLLLNSRVLQRSCQKNKSPYVQHDRIGQTTYSNTSGHTRSKTDSDPHHVYHTIVHETGNYQFYDHIQNSGQENNPQYIIVL